MKKKKIRTKREQQLGYYEGELKTIIILAKDLYKTWCWPSMHTRLTNK